tara:strand:+ start:226 stop:702 length:477 start_codon:yes stop_codon:yes gene_type:complete
LKVVVISGYFNPIHIGHIDYIQEARKLGDKLIVIVNNDEQVKIKKSIPFMSDHDRIVIVKNIVGVDIATLSIDVDATVCKTLKREYDYHCQDYFFDEMIFANGGDRGNGHVPEEDLCNELGIRMVYNVGGEKTESSSSLIKKFNSNSSIIETSKIRGL